MNISLIIPSYKRPKLLKHTINKFLPQLSPGDEIILIIHSNDPHKGEYKHLANEISGRTHTTLIINPTSGLCHSFNLAMSAASNDILFFSDDDCIPDSCLVENHLKVYDRFPQVKCVCGRITPALFDGEKSTRLTTKPALPTYRAWCRPMAGMEAWCSFLSRGGSPVLAGNPEFWFARGNKLMFSIPIGSGNMSFKRKSVGSFSLDESQKRAFYWEAHLFLAIWTSSGIENAPSSLGFVVNLDANTFHVQNVEYATSRPTNIRDSIELSKEGARFSFRAKSMMPKKISWMALLQEKLIHMLNLLLFSVAVYSKRETAGWHPPARYTGEFIGTLIGLVSGFSFYLKQSSRK